MAAGALSPSIIIEQGPSVTSESCHGQALSLSSRQDIQLARNLVMGSYSSKNKLSVEDMTFLQAKTQLDQASIQGWYEGFLKDCPSGELTKEQFVEMYSKIFPSGNADNFSKNIFRTFDTNNSGTIDFR